MYEIVERSAKYRYEHAGDTNTTDAPRKEFARIVKGMIRVGLSEQSIYQQARPEWHGGTVTYTFHHLPSNRASIRYAVTFRPQ